MESHSDILGVCSPESSDSYNGDAPVTGFIKFVMLSSYTAYINHRFCTLETSNFVNVYRNNV